MRGLGVALLAAGALVCAQGAAHADSSVSIDKQCGPQENVLTVTAGGLTGQEIALVYVERPNTDVVTRVRTIVDRNGGFSTRVPFVVSHTGEPLPPVVRIGVYNTKLQLQATTWYFLGCADMTVQAPIVKVGGLPQSVGVTLTGFAPDTPVELSIPGVPPAPAQLPAAGNRFIFPTQPECGPTTVTARQHSIDHRPPTPPIGIRAQPRLAPEPLTSPPDRVVTKNITILCSTVTARPSTFADSALPATTTADGTWFAANYPIDLLLDDKKIGEAHAGQQFTFSQRVRVPRTTCGGHRFAAVQTIDLGKGRGGDKAAAGQIVTLSAATVITVTCAKADLAIDPAVTEGGRLVEATGGKFLAGRTVKLEWVGPDGQPIADAGTAVVDAAGAFTADAFLLPNSDLGPRRLHAVDQPAPGDPRGAREGFADVLVVPAAMQRGRTRFLERG